MEINTEISGLENIPLPHLSLCKGTQVALSSESGFIVPLNLDLPLEISNVALSLPSKGK